MSTAVLTPSDARPVEGSPSRLRHLALVVGLVVAPWCWLVTNTAYMVAIRGGGSDATGAESLALAAEHPTLMRVALEGVLIGGILVVPAVLGMFRLAPRSRLVAVGGSLMIAGYVCYAGLGATAFTTLAMVDVAGPVAHDAAVLDAAMADVWVLWTFLLFVLGNLVGTLVLAAGLWRSRAVPRWVAGLLAAWPVLHVFGLVAMRNEVPQVVGALLQCVAFAACAVVLHRGTRQREEGY